MKPIPIPVRILGPGSQPVEEEALQVLQMDREVAAFAMPEIPRAADDAHMAAARDLLAGFHDRLCGWRDGEGPELDMTRVPPGPLAMANQMLGEGDVAIRINGSARPLQVLPSGTFGRTRTPQRTSRWRTRVPGLRP